MTSGKTTLFLVALGSFAVGMAVDRILFAGRGSGDGAQAGEDGRRSVSGLQSAKASGPAAGRGDAPGGHRGKGGERSSGDREEGEEGEIPHAVREILEGIERGGRVDAAIVAAVLEQMPDARLRRNVRNHLASLWGRQDPEAAVAWADELSGREQREALEHILHGWAETDPAGAANYAVSLPGSEHSLHLVRRMAHLWAEQDQAAALQWGLAQTNPAARGHALGGVVASWGNSDPAAAAQFASSIESRYERHEVLEMAARRWANRSTEEALAWAQALPGDDRQRATNAILHEVAERNPGRAAAIYEEITAALPGGAPHSHEHRQMAREIAGMWSSAEPREAAAWAIGLPEEGEVRRGAVAEVAERWLHLDSMAAGDWISQLPPGEVRDAASERVIGTVIHSDPATAFEWANTVSDEGHRTGLMREVLHRWRNTDPGAAQAALGAADLNAEQRRELGEVFGGVAPSPPEPENGERPE